MPHHFNDHNAAVAVRRGVNSVDGFGGNVKRGVEAESHISKNDVIVNCLGKSDYIQTFIGKKARRGVRAVSAQTNERVQSHFFIILFDCFDRHKASFGVRLFRLERLFAASSQKRSAERQNSRQIFRSERNAVSLHQAAIAVFDSDEFHSIVNHARATNSANCRVQSRGITPAGENAHLFYRSLAHKIIVS